MASVGAAAQCIIKTIGVASSQGSKKNFGCSKANYLLTQLLSVNLLLLVASLVVVVGQSLPSDNGFIVPKLMSANEDNLFLKKTNKKTAFEQHQRRETQQSS